MKNVDERLRALLKAVERMGGGDIQHQAAISADLDDIDALAFAINGLVAELHYTTDSLRRAKDQAEAANRAKSNFLRNVSHEIRTPLSAILGMAQLLMSASISPTRRSELHQRIHSNGRALLDLVNDLLDLSKVETGKLDVALAPTRIVEAATETVADLEAQALARRLTVTLHADADVPECALVDARRLRQVLTHLVDNAIRSSTGGGVELHLSRGPNGEWIYVDVTNAAGVGGDSAVPSPSVDDTKSNGIGLTLAKRLTDEIGGALELLWSAPDEGSTYRLTLRASRDEMRATSNGAVANPLLLQRTERGAVRILLAEDDADIRTVTADLLRDAGAEVIEVEDGERAVSVGTTAMFDVILMDVRMPRMNGLEATRRLRAAGIRTPIFAVTADTMFEHRDECLTAGCDAHIPKPIELHALLALITHATTVTSS